MPSAMLLSKPSTDSREDILTGSNSPFRDEIIENWVQTSVVVLKTPDKFGQKPRFLPKIAFHQFFANFAGAC